MIRCPRCDYESLTGSMFCEKCGYNLTGVKIRLNPDYQPRQAPRSERVPDFPGSFSARPTPAPRPVPISSAPVPAPPPRPVPAPPTPAYTPAPVATPVPAAAPSPVPAYAQPVSSPSSAPAPSVPAISPEEAALRAGAYCALEARGGKPVFYISLENVTIGRTADNDVALEAVTGSRSVSRRHARIVRQNAGVFIEDLGSSNGTYVNGTRLLPEVQTQIYDNDELRFGASHFVFHLRRKG
ncbi:FHA domain-containing protein [bacterium]|nr:FHA domain-containing protein [bacterium]